MTERLSARAQMALIGDPSTYRVLEGEERVVFAADVPPLETVFKAMELGLRVTLQRFDGRCVTFERVPDE